MRSPALALSLFVATIAASAQPPLSSQDDALSPTAQGGIGSFHINSPRQYSSGDDQYSRQIDRERGDANRERTDSSRFHPETPHMTGGFPASAQGKNGGISTTSPAVGVDAGQGGDSVSSADSGSASGANLYDKLSNINVAPGLSQSHDSAADDSYAFQPEDSAYSYHMKRVARRGSGGPVYSRQDVSVPEIINVPSGDQSNGNSNQDGTDGQSIKGSEHQGDGPHGGQAHSGEPGSSEGGHVYNYPSRR
ncbi:hypothetical protein L227DRAFT_651386 [Lentinus tigrinus ALCF2SS1-6]|uniref:Uncharacterized protein n=1 Tax=Lentinus tigrinus ALCF2SS1-6 TaxID=1328759 RepID=A0A5C2SH37_9APHY|nr:hypothetical protein L227DRAFT_651386 [Lentinus tigrinus ALCF2SS1-6]